MELDRLKTRLDLAHIIGVVGDRLENDRDFDVIHIPTKTYPVSKTNDDDILEDIRYAFANALFMEAKGPKLELNPKKNCGHMVLKNSKSRGPITGPGTQDEPLGRLLMSYLEYGRIPHFSYGIRSFPVPFPACAFPCAPGPRGNAVSVHRFHGSAAGRFWVSVPGPGPRRSDKPRLYAAPGR